MTIVQWVLVAALAFGAVGIMPLSRSEADLPLRLVVTRSLFAWFLIAVLLFVAIGDRS